MRVGPQDRPRAQPANRDVASQTRKALEPDPPSRPPEGEKKCVFAPESLDKYTCVFTYASQGGTNEDKYTCVFTYASQGGTNEKWQMSLGTSEDHQHFTCTIWRPQGKSYLYFTQFKAEVRGAEIEYGMAYSKAAFERESDVPLKNEEFEVTKTAVSHRPGAFKAELSKLVIVAKASRSEL
ncbi:PREDICTED: myeloid-derived growth factor [Myotis brandtii]|nr:PREDICTED: myeloid-derived growth factor [Myotis brandtii]